MEVSNVNFQGKKVSNNSKTNKNSFLASAGAYIGGMGASTVASGSGLGVLAAINKIGKVSDDKVEILHKAAEKAIDVTGLAKDGVKIEYLKNTGAKKPFWQMLTCKPLEQVKQGYNAAFVPSVKILGQNVGNTVYMPQKDMAFAAFHEIGHAINFNKSNFWKKMQKLRMPCMALATLPMLYGAVTKKSVAPDGQELSKKQKLNNFLRDNAGKLSFAAMIPVLAEEGMASIRGQKLANKMLDGKLAKHVLKGNTVAYLSYLGSAAALAVGSYAAVKIKDALLEKKNNKQA